QATQPATSAPPANPADVKSIDAILTALYDVISGPAGQPRNWDRFRSLFIPQGGRLIPTGPGPHGALHRVITPEEYAAQSGPGLERNGFFEREIARTTETFGNVTHAFSSYESKRTAQDEKPFSRGINSIQLLNDGKRWYVVTIFWDSERPNNPIATKYLPK
ncbi:MAG TPA: hypothetical protein VM076_13685, partial [Gemmatimonadaceae bacterium]|nr:hypothetical protein [Gemmatimonadaceae bacterium]